MAFGRNRGLALSSSPAEGQQSTAAPVGERTSEANANEPARQNMQQETPEKFLCGDRHQPVFAFTCVIFPAESYFAVSEIDDLMVGDGDPVRVPGQILKDGYGHTSDVDPSDCIDQAVSKYLITTVTPPSGTVMPTKSRSARP